MKQSRPSLAILNEDYPKVRDIQNIQETDGLINYLLTILNIKVSSKDEADDLKIQMLVVSDFIKTKFGTLTIPEIKEAFKMFVAREFPGIKVFRILDCVSIGQVLNAYIDYRNENLRTYEQKKKSLLEAPKSISEEEKKNIREQFLKMIFEDLKAKAYSDDAHRLYDELDALGKIKISDIDKKILYRKEEEKFFQNEKMDIRNRSAGFKAQRLMKDLNSKSGKPIEQVKNKCKSIVVSEYLCKHLESFEEFKKAVQDDFSGV